VVALVRDPGWLAVLLVLGLLASLRLAASAAWRWDALEIARRGALLAVLGTVQSGRDLHLWGRWRGRRRAAAGAPRGAGWLARWWLPLLLTAGFLILFCLANPLIDNAVTRVFKAVEDLIEFIRFPEFARILFWGAIGLAAWALLRTRLRGLPRRVPRVLLVGAGAPPAAAVCHAGLIVRCLALFNLLFLVQNLLDLRFLWGGAALPRGLTYAQYAHRGAYPLVATALLAALFVLVAFPARADTAAELRTARRLVYAWLLQNVFLTLCALQRLHLYVETYSLTRLRLAAALWMGLVALGLALIGWRVFRGRDNRWLVNANAVALAAVLYACCFPDLDGFIARYNVAHCEEVRGQGPALDVKYLEHLGPEALPALRAFTAHTAGTPAATRAAAAAGRLQERLASDLANWRGWSWERDRLSRQESRTSAAPPDGR
jgi:hypothetical protein